MVPGCELLGAQQQVDLSLLDRGDGRSEFEISSMPICGAARCRIGSVWVMSTVAA
jgi:hypothetical protein